MVQRCMQRKVQAPLLCWLVPTVPVTDLSVWLSVALDVAACLLPHSVCACPELSELCGRFCCSSKLQGARLAPRGQDNPVI